MSNESLPTTGDTDQTEPVTHKEMIRSLVREEIDAWWESGGSVSALKRAESAFERRDGLDEERVGSTDVQVERAEVVVEPQSAELIDESLGDGQAVGDVRELGQLHESSPTADGCGDHSVGEQEVPADVSRAAGTPTERLVDEYARVFLDGASEWWRQDDPHFTPAPMTPAVKSGIRRVLAKFEAERSVPVVEPDGMDESGRVAWTSVAGANVYAMPQVVHVYWAWGKFMPKGARRLAAALVAAADVAEGRS